MKTQTLGASTLVSSRLAYGCMRIAGTWKPLEVTAEKAAHGRRSVIAAYEAGYTLFDHADIYCRGMSETIFGQALKEVGGMRERILIATKCGIRFAGDPAPDSVQRYDFSPEYIVWSCEQSLKRLGIEQIDLYQLHRPDLLMEPAAVAEAFEDLKKAGKVREFGVSNFAPSTLTALQKACSMRLIVNQVEIHLGRLAAFEDGTLDQCLSEGITPLSWSPLGGGFLGEDGKVDKKHERRDVMKKLLTTLDEIAERYGVSRTIISLAWLLKHPSGIIPIVGSNNPDRIRQAVSSLNMDMTREDWYRILVAARGKAME